MEFDVLWAALHGVSAYAELLKTPVMEQSRALVGSLAQGRGTEALEAYTQLFHLLRREGYQGLGDWLWDGLGCPGGGRLHLLTLTALRRFTRRMAAACSPATGPLSGTAGS